MLYFFCFTGVKKHWTTNRRLGEELSFVALIDELQVFANELFLKTPKIEAIKVIGGDLTKRSTSISR